MSDALNAAIAQQEARKVARPVAEAKATEVATEVARSIATEVADRTALSRLPAEVVRFLRANPPDAGPPGGPGLVWRGPWLASEDYSPRDVVESEGSSYVAAEPSQGQRPPGPTWDLLARKGDQGVQGHRVLGGGGPGAASPSGSGSALTVLDEGTPLDTAVTSLDFTGAGVTATNVGHAVTVDVPTPPLAEVLAAGPGTGGQAIGAADEPLILFDGVSSGLLGEVLTAQPGGNGLWQPKVYVGRARAMSVDTTNGDPTILGFFTQDDIGSTVKGPGIPANTTIDSAVDTVSATLNHNATATATVTVRLATPDPGAVGAGNIWLRAAVFPSGESGTGYALYVRTGADNGWLPVASAVFDNAGNLRGATINKDNAADAYEIRTWDTAGGMRNDISVYDTAMEFIHSRADGTTASRVAIGDFAGSGEGAVTVQARSADGLSTLAKAVVGPDGIDLFSDTGTITFAFTNLPMPFLDPTTATAEDICNALIAAGLMLPS